MNSHSILIVGSMYPELETIWKQVASLSATSMKGRHMGTGYLNDIPVTLLESGAGVYNMTQALTACLEMIQPDLIVHVGCGGGFAACGMNIGDLAVAVSEIVVDWGIETPDGRIPLQPLPFPAFGGTSGSPGTRIFLDATYREAAFHRLKAEYAGKGVRTLSGAFVTGSMVTSTDRRARELVAAYHPLIESMEGAAAAFVSVWYQIPMVEIRSASNLVGNRKRETWEISLACRRAAEAAMAVLPDLFALSGERTSGR